MTAMFIAKTRASQQSAGITIVAATLTVLLALPATAIANQKAPRPPFIQKLDAEQAFAECLKQDLQARGIAEGDFGVLLKEQQQGPALVDMLQEVYGGALASATESAELKRAASLGNDAQVEFALARLSQPRREDDPLGMEAVRAFTGFNLILAAAAKSACDVPAHLQPGGDPEKVWVEANKDALAEAMTFTGCMREREAPDMSALDTAMPAALKSTVREQVLARARDIPSVDPERLDKLAGNESIDLLLVHYSLLATMSFHLPTMMKADSYVGFYQNKYSGGGCTVTEGVRRIGEITVE